jgi:hypothetical protein
MLMQTLLLLLCLMLLPCFWDLCSTKCATAPTQGEVGLPAVHRDQQEKKRSVHCPDMLLLLCYHSSASTMSA